MTVGDKFVADEKGGVISITANIVTREAGQGGSTGGNNGGNPSRGRQINATQGIPSLGQGMFIR